MTTPTLPEAARMALEALEAARDVTTPRRFSDWGGPKASLNEKCQRAISGLSAALAASEAQPTSEQGWLHRLDMEKAEAWQQGYAKGLQRAGEAPTTLTDYELTLMAMRAGTKGGGLHPWWMILCREVEAATRRICALEKLAAESQRLGLYDAAGRSDG